ncbi:unnamed protein product [marine sediment metagenome]|uniref:Uncharacterized protein n=1 Tax=marine sediment metagenome TaxID=412755 RepID=X0ZKE0_9ZZZZ
MKWTATLGMDIVETIEAKSRAKAKQKAITLIANKLQIEYDEFGESAEVTYEGIKHEDEDDDDELKTIFIIHDSDIHTLIKQLLLKQLRIKKQR